MNVRMNSQLTQLVEQVLSNFDFDRVKKVMDFLKWEWASQDGEFKIPNTYELIKFAKKELWNILERSYKTKENLQTTCGGFRVEIEWYNNECYLSLSFILTEWSEWSEKLNENEVQEEIRVS